MRPQLIQGRAFLETAIREGNATIRSKTNNFGFASSVLRSTLRQLDFNGECFVAAFQAFAMSCNGLCGVSGSMRHAHFMVIAVRASH
jgi:hypothetical protein